MTKTTYICLFTIGLLPGIIIVLLSLSSIIFRTKLDKQIIGGNSFPTYISLSKTNFTFNPSWMSISLLTLGIIFYMLGLIMVVNKNHSKTSLSNHLSTSHQDDR